MTTVNPIGTTKGPGESHHEYLFITPDRDGKAKVGEFVYYEVALEENTRRVLGRISGRQPVRLFPNGFLSDPDVPPKEIASLMGFQEDNDELFEITVAVLGYYDESLGDFINPRIPPRMGKPIYVADAEMLTQVLSKLKKGKTGGAHVGSLLSRAAGEVPVTLDLRAMISTHLAIIASTGSGKSYLAGVLTEELMSPHNRAAMMIVDPHGEYNTLAQIQGIKNFQSEDGYRPQVNVIRPEDVKVRISSLSIGDLRYLLPNLSERMHYLLGKAYGLVQQMFGEKWTIDQFLVAVREAEKELSGKEDDAREDGDSGDDYGTAGALIWRLNSRLKGSTIFDNLESLPLKELFRPGQCTVLQLNEIDHREQQVIVATLLRRLFKARMDTEKGKTEESEDTHIPYPAFVLLEEAHRFAPATADLVSSQVLKTILSEGRKFGVGVGLISQRPGKLDSDVLSQCMSQFLLRIVNPIDQKKVAEGVESVGRDLLKELPALSKGQAVISGAAVNTPILCRVRKRITEHGAEDVDAPTRWVDWTKSGAEERHQKSQALPHENKPSGKNGLFKT